MLKYTTFLFNIDGFLWDWKSIQKDFIDIFYHLIEHNRRVVLLTNNSAYSKLHLTKKLQEKGLRDLEEGNIFTSTDALIYYLYKNKISKVYVIGEYGLVKELEDKGITISSTSSYVVLGIDRTLNYEKLRTAFSILKQEEGVLFYLDNALYWRIGQEIYPITIPLMAYLESAINKPLNKLFLGKPSLYFKEALLNTYNIYPSTSILVSNNKNDMHLAYKLGIDSMLISDYPEGIIKELPSLEKPKYFARDINFVKNLL